MYASLPREVQACVLEYVHDRDLRRMYEVSRETAQVARAVLRRRIEGYRAQYAADATQCRQTLMLALNSDDARVAEIAARLAAAAPARYFDLQHPLRPGRRSPDDILFAALFANTMPSPADDNALQHAVRMQAHRSLAALLRVGCTVCVPTLRIALRQPTLLLDYHWRNSDGDGDDKLKRAAQRQTLVVQDGIATLRALLVACPQWQTLAARDNLAPLEFVFASDAPLADWGLAASAVLLEHATNAIRAPPYLHHRLDWELSLVEAATSEHSRQVARRSLARYYQYVTLYRRYTVVHFYELAAAADRAAQMLHGAE